MSWAEVPLHKVADLESGFGFPRERQGDPNQEFPFFRVSDMNLAGNEVLMTNHTNTVSRDTLAVLHARAFPPGTVIFPKIGAAIATEKKRILAKPATYDNNVMGAVPRDVVNPRFLYYWFLRLRLSDFASASHVPSIRKSVMEQIPFALPPPSEQRRIVETLDQADALRKLRRDADAKAARILPALFLKMFGDPATNPLGWPSLPLSRFAGVADRRNPTSMPSDRFRYIDIAGVDGEAGRIAITKDLSGAEAPSRARQIVRSHDTLVSTVRPYLRATALVPQYLDGEIASTGFCVLRPKHANGYAWLYQLTRQRWFTEQLNARARGASYPAVKDDDIFDLRVPIPNDLDALQLFDRTFEEVDVVTTGAASVGRRITTLFNLLLQSAFSGQLTAKWRHAHMQELLIEMQEQARLLNLPIPETGAPAS